jgi:hypothetical protein
VPESDGQRGLFGRGLRDVWLAQGGGRIEGVREGRVVESWFFPDESATQADLEHLGLSRSGTRVTVPLSMRRLPANGRLRSLVAQLVQLRPVLEDPAREVWLELPGEPAHRVTYPSPEPDPDRPTVFDDEVELMSGAGHAGSFGAPPSRSRSRRCARCVAAGSSCDPDATPMKSRLPAWKASPARASSTAMSGASRWRRSSAGPWSRLDRSSSSAPIGLASTSTIRSYSTERGVARLSDCTPEKISRGQCSSRALDVRFLRIASKTR